MKMFGRRKLRGRIDTCELIEQKGEILGQLCNLGKGSLKS